MMQASPERWHQRMFRLAYSLILGTLLPLLLLVFRKKLSMQGKHSTTRSFAERFGSVPAHFKQHGVLVHCVSIGELNASLQLVKRIQQVYPDLVITISTSSTTGAEHAYNLYGDAVQHIFLPIDLSVFMRRFFDALQPKLVLVTEVEIWPNMLALCSKRDIPACLINARLSDDALPRYQRMRFLLRPALLRFTYICAQSQSSYDNFKAMGVYKHQLRLSRNMKFDLKPSEADGEKAQTLRKQMAIDDLHTIFTAASTHEGEEQFALSVYTHLKASTSNLRMIVVPRHPHRFDEVYLQLKASGFSVFRCSEYSSENARDMQRTDIVLMDKMGWLKACYAISDAAFIGGSIAQKGGHNALECALYAKAMVMGPSIYNNPSITRLLEAQGALTIVEDEVQCSKVLARLFAHPELAKKSGAQGAKVLADNSGAVDISFDLLKEYL